MNTLHQFDEVFDTQVVFRRLLEAMSNPTRTVSILEAKEKLFGTYPSLLALAMTLLDNEVSFHTCGDDTLKQDIQLVTLSSAASLEEGDYIFITDAAKLPDVFLKVKYGTLVDPHCSATLLIRDSGEKNQSLFLYGSGIDGETLFHCTETAAQAIALRDAQEYEYPTGVDLVLVSDDGEVTCIPRLVRRREQVWHM